VHGAHPSQSLQEAQPLYEALLLQQEKPLQMATTEKPTLSTTEKPTLSTTGHSVS